MAVISYGTDPFRVTLPYCEVTSFKNKALRDDSDTDWYSTQFDVGVTCLINTNYLTWLAPNLVGLANNPVDLYNVIRPILLKPRQTLSVKCANHELIPQPQTKEAGGSPLPGRVDVANGPKPQSCNIVQMTDNLFIMEYSVQATYWENYSTHPSLPVSNQAGNNVLYNRWTEKVEMDDCQYSTRTREGKFMIRSDNASGFIADQMRSQMAVLSVPEGFLRQSTNYSLSPDGLTLSYTITDKEVFKLPPDPAFHAEGEYTESSNTPGGSVRFAACRVSMRAPKTVPQAKLVSTAVGVAAAKCLLNATDIKRIGVPGNKAKPQLMSSSIQIGLYDNTVEVNLRYMIQTIKQRRNGIAGFALDNPGAPGSLTYTPGSEKGEAKTPPYKDRGSAGLILQAAGYWDPNLSAVTLGPGFDAVPDNPLTDTNNRKINNAFRPLPGTAGANSEI